MSLKYKCDHCGKSKKGTPISGLLAEIADCLPEDWGMCRCDRARPVEILCGDCYTKHRKK